MNTGTTYLLVMSFIIISPLCDKNHFVLNITIFILIFLWSTNTGVSI